MAAPPTMETVTHIATAADMEIRAARIADPLIELKVKNVAAGEIREMLDTIRDVETARVLPFMIPTLLQLLRTGEPAMRNDTLEYAFRRVVLEILNRLPTHDVVRPHAVPIFECLLYVIRHDNEDIGVTCCKTIIDLVKHYRCLNEEILAEFTAIFQESFGNMHGLVNEVLSENSIVLDEKVVLPSMRSFKVLAEMGLVMAMFSQVHRNLIVPAVQTTIPPAFEVLSLESPAQKTAREDFEAMGGYWAGMSPTIRNVAAYAEFVNAQIKMLSYLAFVMRLSSEHKDSHGERLILCALRILQDCPANGIALRKELMVVFRHLMGTVYRRALVGQLDKLLDERVLLGTGISSQEMLRPPVYSAVADLLHHLKNELTPTQLARIVHVYSRLMHDPACGTNLHTMFAKMMFGTHDAIIAKETPQGAARLLGLMFETCLDRLDALTIVQEEILAALERNKRGVPAPLDGAFIEKARPVGGASFAIEKPEDVVHESRMLFRTLLHGFRVCLMSLKKVDAPTPEGTLIFRLFEGCIRCMSLFDPDARTNEPNDAIDWFAPVLMEINLHVFQEVWTHKIEFFFECAQKRVMLLNVCQFLFSKEGTSPTLLAIVLKFLVERLPLLGEYDDLRAAATIRLFKMAFGAVNQYPSHNEPILASHLAKLLMDCFPLAAKATKPTHYFHLLRALFRAIGGGGGRFELLYKEVLPLLPEMLEQLNRQLLASEGTTRDMIVELCLTVPLRLTHLLPHLTYLMQPLALALRGGPELVSQGLRTLELCIDNLTPDFLDPTLSTVLRELMEALHSHLKPLPANHHVAHTTIRILGKLGGRNRRLLSREPALSYHHHSETAKFSISFAGNMERIELGPMSLLACRTLKGGFSSDIVHAYNYLESCLSMILYEGIKGRNMESLFISTLEGVFDAIHLSEVQEQAEQFLRKLSQSIFEAELKRNHTHELPHRPPPSPLFSSFLDALPHALAREQADDATKARQLVSSLIEQLVVMGHQPNVTLQEIMSMLHQIANRFTALCLDDSWVRKSAGCSGIKIMTGTPEVGTKWVTDREVDLVRTLLHILKDLPPDLPHDIDEVVDVLTSVLRISNAGLDFRPEGANPAYHKLISLVGIFFPELQSSNPVVRQAAQTCIALLVEFSGRPAVDLLMPHRDRMLNGIYTKPLRALPFPIQIGMIEAIRYCISLDPPLVELNDELLRLLHETLALADAEDLNHMGRGSPRQSSIEVTKLRVACIKLLTASMPLTDFFQRQTQTRQRVTGVYFKSLYSPSSEVKDVAHEGLRMVLLHQSRLPKELLQTGLRPILMNLADPKRLSVPGLEGLARLLELLTNYFKVEIGHKLLDHFRIVADPQMLQASSQLPLGENEGITKLVRLANIFHLLPSAANIFLENLVNAIVQTEAQMHFSAQSPFSEPLAKYLDRYPVEGIDFFMRHLNFPRHLRTLRSILQARLAPALERELASRTHVIVAHYFKGNDKSQLLPALLLFNDMASLRPTWITDNDYVIDVLLDVWHSEVSQPVQTAVVVPDVVQRHSLILSIFMRTLEQSPRIDLLFEVVSIYTRNLEMDLVHVTQFLYKQVALSNDVIFRRNVLMRFLTWFEDPAYTWSHKASFIRYIVTPTVLIQASRTDSKEQLLDVDFIDRVHRIIWSRIPQQDAFPDTDDMFKIEMLHFTTVMVHHHADLVEHVRKDIMKCAWYYISISDDPIVKQTAFLLTARFFAAFQTPQKFILRTWTGLLRFPHTEGRAVVRQEALAALAPSLPSTDPNDVEYPPWALTARRLLAEEGLSQLMTVYYLIVKQPVLFYPVRGLFVTHMVNNLQKLGLTNTASPETRLLSIDILQVIFNWESQATKELQNADMSDANKVRSGWITPLGYRENMVSYLVRLATVPYDLPARNVIVPRTLSLLQVIVGPNGWTDVAFGLRFFSRALEMNELNTDQNLSHAIASAKVLQVIASEQSDAWYIANKTMLQKLVRKGMVTEEYGLHDALHPIVDRLLHIIPLPKEDDDQQGEDTEFHSFLYSAVGDGLRNGTTLRGILLMLKSIVEVTPERIEPFASPLMKLLSKLTKDHVQASPPSVNLDNAVRLLNTILDVCQISIGHLGDQRRWLLSNLVVLVEKSKNHHLCRYILELSRTWAMVKHDSYPTMKEKASLLQKMAIFEAKGDILFNSYLELIYEIYTDSNLRRSDLTSRLEQSFLLGCRARDPALRERFMDLLDVSVPRSLFARLTYICGVQSWEALADHNWIHLALHLILGSAELDATQDRRIALNQSGPLIPRPKTQSIVRPMQRLLFLDPQTAHHTWVSVFPAAWACLSKREQTDVTHHMINLLSKDYYIRQAEVRPNVIQTLLTGIHACSPPMLLPPHLVKYLAKTFGAWHVALEILSASLEYVKEDEGTVRDFVYDSLAEVYAELGEDDMFYGIWRRRSLYPETNIAIAFEQNSMWDQAYTAYETAQNRSRAGSIPYSETEYHLWEDHWILSAEKLQHWDILYDLAKADGNQELMLESAWRIKDWPENKDSLEEQINLLPEVATPRRRVFEAFIALLKTPAALDKNTDFTRILEDAMQLSLRKWVGLPPHLSTAHVPLLQHFQQFVELQEAVQIFGSLSQTNAGNLEKKSAELKMVLQAWRERLPNLHDDISIWSDLVAWRQNVFNAINTSYIPLIGGPNSAGAATSNSTTYGYRGYHETAWIINRFAHVARKHDLLDACFTSLAKIYTLPNIEISEAFLKLREQARCYYQKPNDLQAGLEVINNTNLVYFSTSQKAEFYTLKGMFHARFGRNEEANVAFGQAVQLDMNQAKAWAEWGRWNDRMFKEHPSDLSYAANAVSCYLQAAGQYKNGKTRPLLARVLWLLSVDDGTLTISRAFDTYKGDAAYWFWITLIPQLCTSMSHREVKQARYVLLNLARHYPQALFFHLRTTREDMLMMRKNAAAMAARAAAQASTSNMNAHGNELPTTEGPTTSVGLSNGSQADPAATAEAHRASAAPHVGVDPSAALRPGWESLEEIVQILKTAFPLLILTLETMVDQLQSRFKPTPEEETYRHMSMLLQDASQSYLMRMNTPDDDGQLTHPTLNTLHRLGQSMTGPVKKDYDEDFIQGKPNHYEYIQRLQKWRDKYEKLLDSRPRIQPLDNLSHYLTEFQYGKVDEIEVPGQYTEEKDNNQNFIRIQKFAPKFENCRSHGTSWKRITIHGSDNSKTSFSVQLPCHRQCRREEKVMQIFRTFNGVLARKKESRKRNLSFHLPVTVSCSPNLRLYQTDSSYIPLGDIYDDHCLTSGIMREQPVLYSGEKVKRVLREFRQTSQRQPTKAEYLTLKRSIFDEVTAKMVPEDILSRYMLRSMDGPGELWRMRKQFALQLVSTSFMTYVMCFSSRSPSRYHVSRNTGRIAMTELLPAISTQAPIFTTSDVVPFRFTPNMQHFVGPVLTEGILTSGIMAMGRCLSEPEFELEQQLCLFGRDEVAGWMASRQKPWSPDVNFRNSVAANIDNIVKKVETLACKVEREQALDGVVPTVPVVQTVTNLISSATNPTQLTKMGELYYPWF